MRRLGGAGKGNFERLVGDSASGPGEAVGEEIFATSACASASFAVVLVRLLFFFSFFFFFCGSSNLTRG